MLAKTTIQDSKSQERKNQSIGLMQKSYLSNLITFFA